MTRLLGVYCDGVHPIARPATLSISGRTANLKAKGIAASFPTSRLVASPEVFQAARFVSLPNGGQFSCNNRAFLNSLKQSESSGPVLAWLERRWFVSLAAVAIIVGMLSAGYLWALPVAAQKLSARIPIEAEHALGERALASLDKSIFEPTTLGDIRQKQVQERFKDLIHGLPSRRDYRLEFRVAPSLGTNALALPGGIIVMTDKMVRISETDDQLSAILAHEIGHVELRHLLKNILRHSGIGLVAAAITSDAATLGGAISGFPVLLAHAKFSRETETEADTFAFALLKKRHISPSAFESFMKLLANLRGSSGGFSVYLDSHPSLAERSEAARIAARTNTTRIGAAGVKDGGISREY